MNEKANNFIKNITEAGAITNKKGTITATYTEGEQIYYICSIDGKVVDKLILEEGRATNELNGMFKSWAEKPVFVTPNLKSFETYSERWLHLLGKDTW